MKEKITNSLLDKAYLNLTFLFLKKMFFLFFGLVLVLYYLNNYMSSKVNILEKKDILIDIQYSSKKKIVNSKKNIEYIKDWNSKLYYNFLIDTKLYKKNKVSYTKFSEWIIKNVESNFKDNSFLKKEYNQNNHFKDFILNYYNYFKYGEKLSKKQLLNNDYNNYFMTIERYNFYSDSQFRILYNKYNQKEKILFIKHLSLKINGETKSLDNLFIKYFVYKYKKNNKIYKKLLLLNLNYKDTKIHINKT